MCNVVFLAPLRTIFRLLLVSATFWACFSAPAAVTTVTITSSNLFLFTPSNSVINAGDTITWRNSSTIIHDSTHNGTPRLWQSGNIGPTAAFSFTFTNAGTFPYFCAVHVALHPEQKGNVIVNSANKPPSVSLTDPTNNQHFFAPATFALRAAATDDVAVATVQFFSGTSSLGSDTSSPFSLTVSNLAQNTYSFSAQAIDNQGARATSAVVTVFVDNVPSVFIENAQMLSSNQFGFRIRGGSAGQRCDIQKSLNLNGDWTTIDSQVFQPTDCPICPFIDFVDPNASPDRRFYKILVSP